MFLDLLSLLIPSIFAMTHFRSIDYWTNLWIIMYRRTKWSKNLHWILWRVYIIAVESLKDWDQPFWLIANFCPIWNFQTCNRENLIMVRMQLVFIGGSMVPHWRIFYWIFIFLIFSGDCECTCTEVFKVRRA